MRRLLAVRAPAHRSGRRHRRVPAGRTGVPRRLHRGPVHHRGGAGRGRTRRFRPAGAGIVFRLRRRFRLPVHDQPRALAGRQGPVGASGLARRVRRRLAGVLRYAGKGRRIPAGVCGCGSRTWPKKPRPKKPSGSACRSSPSTTPRICTIRRSIVIAAFSARCTIPCWVPRPIRPSRTRSARRRQKSPLPHRLSAGTPGWCWIHSTPRAWRRSSSQPNSRRSRIRAADRCTGSASWS